jgi:hypothetical protein
LHASIADPKMERKRPVRYDGRVAKGRAIEMALLTLVALIVPAVLVAVLIGSKLRRRPYETIEALRDEVAALSGQVDRLRERVERIEQRNGPQSDAIKAGN